MLLCEKNNCTGCAACCTLCPGGSISMTENAEGFRFPVIDQSVCVECGICAAACPVLNENNANDESPRAYAIKISDRSKLSQSSSGGAFIALAEVIISSGGIVYGAAFDSDLNVRHIRADSMAGVKSMQGSKYLESNMNDAHLHVKRDLSSGRKVLFTGCPCQIAGLMAALQQPFENLYTIDLICHGVPSRKLWQSYLGYLRDSIKRDIIAYSFRDKSKWGWGSWGSYTYYNKRRKSKKHYFTVPADYYYSLYFQESCFRESCYTCKFAALPRQGDVSLGDFWGIERVFPDFDYSSGVSVLLSNNRKGDKLVSSIKDKTVIWESTTQAVVENNQTVIKAAERPPSRNDFYLHFDFEHFEITAKKYCKKRVFLPTLSRYIPRRLKNMINYFRV